MITMDFVCHYLINNEDPAYLVGQKLVRTFKILHCFYTTLSGYEEKSFGFALLLFILIFQLNDCQVLQLIIDLSIYTS